jgi:hypothetical protein
VNFRIAVGHVCEQLQTFSTADDQAADDQGDYLDQSCCFHQFGTDEPMNKLIISRRLFSFQFFLFTASI